MSEKIVTSELWTVTCLNQRQAVCTVSIGSKPLLQANGYLSATKIGKGMKIVFNSPQGYKKELNQRSVDSASIDEHGIFRFCDG